mmetsp:Transcript_72089/g.141410  ORF Transcript_72089/g.141410 Transcript_72089/m.141410 type:complete len:205 (+) Transcript_72089:438-1052(+)
MGIWCEGWDRTDANSVSRSADGKLIVLGDDYGKVHLVNAPCLVKHAPRRCYRGHSSHVACVSFLKDGNRVVTCGGRDMAVFQYRVVSVSEAEGEANMSGGGGAESASLMLREGTSGRLKTTSFGGGGAAAHGDNDNDDDDPDAKGERWGEFVVVPHKGLAKPAWLKMRYVNGPPPPLTSQRRHGKGGGGGGGGGFETTARAKTR